MSAPTVTSAAFLTSASCRVVFSEAMTGAALTTPAAWALVPVFGGAAAVIDSIVQTSDDTVALALGAPVIPDTIYRATCPATVTDLDLNAIDGAHRVADFVTPPLTVAAEPESGNPWAAAADGTQVLDPPFELVPWGPAEPDMTIEQMVWVSLFSDRRAGPDDELPDTGSGPVYRGGCWFDPDFGSLLWLLVRAAINSTTLLKVRQYSIEALQWMVDDGIAAKIDVSAERQGIDQIALKVTVYKADGTTEAVNFPDLWAAYQQAA